MSAINVRVEPGLRQLIETVASARGEDVSSFVRLALKRELAKLDYLSDSEKQALGLFDQRKKSRRESTQRAKPVGVE